MTHNEEIKAIFEKLPWINLSVFGQKIGISRQNLQKYVSGKLEISDKTYRKIMDGLAEIKNDLP